MTDRRTEGRTDNTGGQRQTDRESDATEANKQARINFVSSAVAVWHSTTKQRNACLLNDQLAAVFCYFGRMKYEGAFLCRHDRVFSKNKKKIQCLVQHRTFAQCETTENKIDVDSVSPLGSRNKNQPPTNKRGYFSFKHIF